jgi:crotonobetainyl-CoA:carnitine CoA-transferase CaiB-like acyl-CoA transferase
MPSASEPPGALHGFRVIDCCEGIGGPFAAMLLAEQGADVIKVERPVGDRLRGRPAFHVLNRSKRGVTIDLETDAGRERLRALVSDADIFLHDWQPGTAEKRGCDGASLRALNPRLVTGWLPAYGSRGPWAHLPPDEALVQALSGLCDAQYRYEPRPVFVNIPVAGYAQAIVGALTAAATLYARLRGGAGDRFELSAIGAVFQFETAAYVRAPSVVRLAGQQDPKGPVPTYRLVKASDDWLFVGALTPPFWAKMAIAAGLDDCLVDERFVGAPLAIANMDDRRELAQRVQAAFATKTREEWLQILEEADVPRAPVRSREEWANDPQVLHNKMIVGVGDPALGPTLQMGVPVTHQSSPGHVKGPAPALGEHNADVYGDAVVARVAGGAEAGSQMQRCKHPLENIVVLDLGGFIAGASCSMMLADLGANVIKIEAPGGDGWRSSGLAFLGSNRSKRGIVLDLKTPEDRERFLRMIEQADVVLDNMRAGVMDKLGIGWEVLHARNPRLVHGSVTGYGATGPYAHLPGFDPMAQSRGGIMRAQGEPGGEPVYLQMALCDYATALTAAFGIITALVARERTGAGDRVETCLANSALTMQAGEFIFYDGRPADPPGGRDLAGRHALYRVYGASDGWLMLACTTDEQACSVASALGVALPEGAGLSHDLYGDVASEIEAAFVARPLRHWLDALLPLGVPVAPCVKVTDLFEDEHLVASDLWWDTEHPQWGAIRQTGKVIQWDAMSLMLSRPAPTLGQHTEEVLREFGVA